MKAHLMRRVMACKVLLLALVVVSAALIPPGGVPPAAAAPPPIERWVARYDGPISTFDYAYALAVDRAGNVYVTGGSYGSGTDFDYATVKYNAAGAQQWEARYENPASGDDIAMALAVDAAGNVYVTGRSYGGAGTVYDYATVKYDASGAEQWENRYNNAPVNGDDRAYALAVDGAGNVYVTGRSEGSGTGGDYATVKYDTNGNKQWVARYDGPASSGESATALAVDGAGNVYVTGICDFLNSTTGDYCTIKYNAAGAQQWVRRYNGPANDYDSASALAVDGAGNVYVTGESTGSGTARDYATVKYNALGVQQWAVRYNNVAVNGNDGAAALALDGAGNVYVTGRSEGSGTGENYATVKYNAADGAQQWVRRYDAASLTDAGNALAVDGAGNVYVTGQSEGSGTDYDYATVKYNAAGVQQWAARYDGPVPFSSYDYANALALDGAGNVYVTGSSVGFGTVYDYATIKYAQQLPHYDCRLAPGMLDPPVVRVDTQFGVDQGVDVGPGFSLCAPALKNGEGVPDTETAHLRCFDAEAAQSAPNRLVNLTTQFGELRNVLVGDRALLCAPASKVPYGVPPPPEPPEPHYLCYHITGPAANAEVIVQSQFTMMGPVPTTVGSPELLCLPAGKNGAPIPDAPHEVCYQAGLPFLPLMYNVLTQFGLEEMLEVLAGNMLCVPAVKEVVEPPETPSFSLKAGAVTGPPDAILELNTVVNGPPVVAIPPAALGLGLSGGPDDLSSLSYGMEYPNNMTPFLRFSMASDYVAPPDGLPWTHVFAESTCMAWPGQAIGDEFDAPFPLPPPGVGNTNTQVLDENGVQDNAACAAPPGYPLGTGAPPGDDLDALEERPPSFVDSNGDTIVERPVFFTLAPGSTTLVAMGVTAAEILMKPPGAGGPLPMIYAPGAALGLNTMPPYTDAIDGLMLYDNGDLTFGPGDWAWLSLAPGSQTLAPLMATEGDVLFVDGCKPGVISIQYTADQLGLMTPLLGGSRDDVDALKGEIPCLTGPDSDLAIGNGKGIAGNDGTVPNGEVPAAIDCQDSDDDNDGYLDQSELLLPDPLSCPGKTALTSPGGDITYDDDNDGNPASGSLGGTDLADDPPSWDSDGDSVLDGAECALGKDPANPASVPTAAQCGGTGDTDGDGLQNAWEYCKWGTDPAVIDSDGDGKGDCKEAADVDGNGVVNFPGDVIDYAKAILLSTAAFGHDGDFDIDGNNVLNFPGDVIWEAKFGLLPGVCK